jgi:hypothetical protein
MNNLTQKVEHHLLEISPKIWIIGNYGKKTSKNHLHKCLYQLKAER